MASTAAYILCTFVIITGTCVGASYVRLLGNESSVGKGELQLLSFGFWTPLCAGSLGIIEGQLACQELGFGLLQELGVSQEPAEESTFAVTHMDCSSRLSVRDSPVNMSIAECDYTPGVGCTFFLDLECSVSSAFGGCVILDVKSNSTSFTIVSPKEYVYVGGCSFTKPPSCSGPFYVSKTIPIIEDLVLQLTGNRSCSGLGPIEFDPCMGVSSGELDSTACTSGASSIANRSLVMLCTSLILASVAMN